MSADSLADREHTVYRMYDATGELLYIGVTSNLRRRLYLHRAADSPTLHFVRNVTRITTEVHPDRASGYAAERAAIMAERPTHNVQYKPSTDEVPDGVVTSTEMVRQIPGLTYRKLDYWCRKGFIAPSVVGASGCGSRRLFSNDDAERAAALNDAAQLVGWVQDGSIWERVIAGEIWFVNVEKHVIAA